MSIIYFFITNVPSSEETLVGGHGVLDPGSVVADLGVDTGLVPLGAAVSPGHDTLQLTVAHHGATGVSLRATEGTTCEQKAPEVQRQ